MGDVSGLAFLVGAPLWVAVLIFGMRSFKDWPGIMARWNERQRDRAAIESEQYKRLAERCGRLELAEEKCRDDLADAVRRIAELEGFMMGQGKARNDAAAIVAVERLKGRSEKP